MASNTPSQLVATISRTFHSGALPDEGDEDIILLSAEKMIFYTHSTRLLSTSSNAFGHLVSAPNPPATRAAFQTADRAAILDIVLHSVYKLPFDQRDRTTTDLIQAVDALHKYGIDVRTYVVPGRPIFTELEECMAAASLDIYICAAVHDLHDLAVRSSVHLLSRRFADIPDHAAQRMGSRYLVKLVHLRLSCLQRLRELLLPLPETHGVTGACGYNQQCALQRAWYLTAAYILWDARPEITVISLELAFSPLERGISCEDCRRCFRERLSALLTAWDRVKRSV